MAQLENLTENAMQEILRCIWDKASADPSRPFYGQGLPELMRMTARCGGKTAAFISATSSHEPAFTPWIEEEETMEDKFMDDMEDHADKLIAALEAGEYHDSRWAYHEMEKAAKRHHAEKLAATNVDSNSTTHCPFTRRHAAMVMMDEIGKLTPESTEALNKAAQDAVCVGSGFVKTRVNRNGDVITLRLSPDAIEASPEEEPTTTSPTKAADDYASIGARLKQLEKKTF